MQFPNRKLLNKSIRVAIITGGGEKCFSAGFDVTDADNSSIISTKARKLLRKIDCFTKPVIAAINGHAMGGGLELAMSCHFRIMTDSPRTMIGLTELNLGIIPGWGGTQRLPRLVGRAKALEMILFSKRITAVEALEIGLINHKSASGSLMDDAFALAGKLGRTPADRCALCVRSVLGRTAQRTRPRIESGS